MRAWLIICSAFLIAYSQPIFASTQSNFGYSASHFSFILGAFAAYLMFKVLFKSIIVINWFFITPLFLSLTAVCFLPSVMSISHTSWYQLILLIVWLLPLSLYLLHKDNKKSTFLFSLASVTLIGFAIERYLAVLSLEVAWVLFASAISFVTMLQITGAMNKGILNLISASYQWVLQALVAAISYLTLLQTVEYTWLVYIVIFYGFSLAFVHVLQLNRPNEPANKQYEEEPSNIQQNNMLGHDPVTNLPTTQNALASLKLQQVKDVNHHWVAVVFKPVNFPYVNKVLGHHNSDILLLQLAYSLQNAVKDSEHLISFGSEGKESNISRLQGLDFLFVVDAKTTHHPINMIVEDLCIKLLDAVPKAMSFKSFSLKFELSFGIANSDSSSQDIEQLIAYASDALLEANNSTQAWHYFDKKKALYTEQQLQKMELLKQELNVGNLAWYVEPQLQFSNFQLKGFEMMVNWPRDYIEGREADDFFRVAQLSGEIYGLTRTLIEKSFQLLFDLHSHHYYLPVSINITSVDVLEVELIDFIALQGKKYNIALKYFIVELHESVILDESVKAKQAIDQMKSLGIKVAIDGFSGSYESLRYLRKLSVHQVKIDCSALKGDSETSSDKTIVNALINLIRKMELPLMATGVDNEDAMATYLASGGEQGQGAVIDNEIELEKASSWLNNWVVKYPINNPVE